MTETIQAFFSAENFCLSSNLFNLCMSFLLNTLAVWTIVHFFYYPKGHRRDYYFTFMLLSVSIFMLIYLLLQNASDMGIGAALGLFAIFGIIRYRTESVPIREMTYLFFLVALSVLNGKTGELNFMSRIIVNLIFVGIVWVCENYLSAYKEGCKFVRYDNIDLITPDQLRAADAAWLVSSVRLAAPVRELDGHPFVVDDEFTAGLNAYLLALRD
jgi:hypothetical protein